MYSELIFILWYKVRVQLYSFVCGYQFFQHYFLKRLSFLYGMVLPFLTKINWPCMWGFFFCDLYCVLLVHMSVLMPVLYCLNNCSYIVKFEVGNCLWVSQLYSSFSRVFWLFGAPHDSPWIWGLAFPFLKKMSLEGLCWIYNLL